MWTNKVSIKINGTCLERIGNDCNAKATKFVGMYIDENHGNITYHNLTRKCPKPFSQLNKLKRVYH